MGQFKKFARRINDNKSTIVNVVEWIGTLIVCIVVAGVILTIHEYTLDQAKQLQQIESRLQKLESNK